MLNKPTLPPKSGYVEVVVNGEHVYKPTPETEAKLAKEAEMANILNTLLGVTENG